MDKLGERSSWAGQRAVHPLPVFWALESFSRMRSTGVIMLHPLFAAELQSIGTGQPGSIGPAVRSEHAEVPGSLERSSSKACVPIGRASSPLPGARPAGSLKLVASFSKFPKCGSASLAAMCCDVGNFLGTLLDGIIRVRDICPNGLSWEAGIVGRSKEIFFSDKFRVNLNQLFRTLISLADTVDHCLQFTESHLIVDSEV